MDEWGLLGPRAHAGTVETWLCLLFWSQGSEDVNPGRQHMARTSSLQCVQASRPWALARGVSVVGNLAQHPGCALRGDEKDEPARELACVFPFLPPGHPRCKPGASCRPSGNQCSALLGNQM